MEERKILILTNTEGLLMELGRETEVAAIAVQQLGGNLFWYWELVQNGTIQYNEQQK